MLGLYITLGVLGLILIAYLALSIYVIKILMFPQKRDNDTLVAYETAEKEYKKEWLDIPYKEMRMTSRYGYKLFARLYTNDNPTNKYMIVLHGHNSSSISQLKYLQIFLDLGYNVFMPDHRRSGLSEGRSVTFGAYEKYDIISWMDMLEKKNPQINFSIFGESMGAATAIMVTAMDKRVRFLIEYCGYASFNNLISDYLDNDFLYKFIMPGLRLIATVFAGVNLKDTNAYKAMKKVSVPTLIIHSKSDKVVMFGNALQLMEANPNAKTKFFEDTIHARSIVKYPEEFTKAITDFVQEVEKK